MSDIQVERLAVIVGEDALFWAMDWVSGPYGNSVIERRHLSFKSRRDAEAFVKAAKRAVRAPA